MVTNPPCPYCGRSTSIRDSSVIYGHSYGLALICDGYPECDAYVGTHKKDGRPLGTLANAELRKARNAAHAVLDPLWRDGHMRRNEAYAWLAKVLDIDRTAAHIAMFSEEQCRQVVEAVAAEFQSVSGA